MEMPRSESDRHAQQIQLNKTLEEFNKFDPVTANLIGHSMWQKLDWRRPKAELTRLLKALGTVKIGYGEGGRHEARLRGAFRIENGGVIKHGCVCPERDPMSFIIERRDEIAAMLVNEEQRRGFIAVSEQLEKDRDMFHSPGEPTLLFNPRTVEAPVTVYKIKTMRKHTIKGIRSDPRRNHIVLIGKNGNELRSLLISPGLTRQLPTEIVALAAKRERLVTERHEAFDRLHQMTNELLRPWVALSSL